MDCQICGKSGCTKNFHNIDEQLVYEKYSKFSHERLITALIEKELDITDLEDTIQEYQDNQCGCCDHIE